MLSPNHPRVESFVLRFAQDASGQEAPHWHAVVLHVQSNEEKFFSDFAEAVAFIARYVPIGDFSFYGRQPMTDDRRDDLSGLENDQ